MSVKILNIFRLSDICGHNSNHLKIKDKIITLNLLNNIKITDYSSHKGLRRLPKVTQNAIVSAIKVSDKLSKKDKLNLGIFVGTSLSYIEHGLQFMATAYDSSPRLVSPLMFPNTVLNSISGWISIVLGSEAINTTINVGNSSGILAIKTASEYVKLGILHYALVVIAEEITNAVIESDLYSSNEYTEEALAILIGEEDTINSLEIKECYSKYTSETEFKNCIKQLNMANNVYSIYGFWKSKDFMLEKYNYLQNKTNLLSCTTVNHLYELLVTGEKNIIICENNKSQLYSYLKIGQSKE